MRSIVAGIVLMLAPVAWAGDHAALMVAEQQAACQKNLAGETQYASMLHDERDTYEQQAAALVIERDSLKKQIQEMGKEIQGLTNKLAALNSPPPAAPVKPIPAPLKPTSSPSPSGNPAWR